MKPISCSTRVVPSLSSVLVMVSLLLAGCEMKGEGVSAASKSFDNGVWRSVPMSMRIYPTTRFAVADGHPILEARVELLDEAGDPVKASGLFHVQLYASDLSKGVELGQQLYTWETPMTTLQHQLDRYDRITRTYLFRLKLLDEAVTQRPTMVRVSLEQPDGPRLQAQGAVLPMQ